MSQIDNAWRFAELHIKGAPLLLYNAWDAGSAKAILAAGARASATSGWSVAAAHGEPARRPAESQTLPASGGGAGGSQP